jgi:hypothetical protein
VTGVGSFIFGGWALWKMFKAPGFSLAAPGQTTIHVAKAGTYTLWNESRTMRNGKILTFPKELPSGTEFEVRKKGGGEKLEVRGNSSETMNINGMERNSVGTIEIPESGDYEVKVSGLGEERAIYMSEAVILKTFLTCIAAGGTGSILLLGGVGLFIYLASRRSDREYHSLQPVK